MRDLLVLDELPSFTLFGYNAGVSDRPVVSTIVKCATSNDKQNRVKNLIVVRHCLAPKKKGEKKEKKKTL